MSSVSDSLRVICLCAEWCGTCREYRAGFDALAAALPAIRFRWLDVEDEADRLGDIDVENFPTLFVARNGDVLFFGTMLPQHGLLQRLLETFLAQTADESRAYARGSAERLAWQDDDDLVRLAGMPIE